MLREITELTGASRPTTARGAGATPWYATSVANAPAAAEMATAAVGTASAAARKESAAAARGSAAAGSRIAAAVTAIAAAGRRIPAATAVEWTAASAATWCGDGVPAAGRARALRSGGFAEAHVAKGPSRSEATRWKCDRGAVQAKGRATRRNDGAAGPVRSVAHAKAVDRDQRGSRSAPVEAR